MNDKVIGAVRMTMLRETKGTVLYTCADGDDSAPLARNIYVTKSHLMPPFPTTIDVTIEVVDDEN